MTLTTGKPENRRQEKFKLLFISSDRFPPFRVDVTILFGEEIMQRGHTIDWLLQSEESCKQAYETNWAGGKAWVGKTDLGNTAFSRLKKHLLSITHDFRMFRLAKKNSYDFIQVKDKFISALLAIAAAKVGNAKFVYWLSYPFPEAAFYNASSGHSRYPLFDRLRGIIFKLLLYKVILPQATHIFVQSDQMRRDVAEAGIALRKISAVPMGVAIDKVPLPCNKPEVPTQERKIVYLGDLSRNRKLDFLIRVFRQVHDNFPNAKLYLVGGSHDTSDLEKLRNYAEKLEISESVIFTGFLPITQGWQHAVEADVCVSPLHTTPIYRPASLTKLVEYMAMQRAVVANEHPDQGAVIEKSGGGICVPYDETNFSDAIIKLLRNPELAHQMGIKGRDYVKNHRSYKIIADRVEAVYLDLINKELRTT